MPGRRRLQDATHARVERVQQRRQDHAFADRSHVAHGLGRLMTQRTRELVGAPSVPDTQAFVGEYLVGELAPHPHQIGETVHAHRPWSLATVTAASTSSTATAFTTTATSITPR